MSFQAYGVMKYEYTTILMFWLFFFFLFSMVVLPSLYVVFNFVGNILQGSIHRVYSEECCIIPVPEWNPFDNCSCSELNQRGACYSIKEGKKVFFENQLDFVCEFK